MKKKSELPRRGPTPRQIVGFSLPPDLATAVKAEAARWNMPLCKLFGEMWGLYNTRKTG
jgi:hypothetical protein